MGPRDFDLAVHLLRRATELAPANIPYREVLALFIADQGRPAEGKAALEAVAANHFMIPFLADLEDLPIPAGSELLYWGHPLVADAPSGMLCTQ